MGSKRIFLGLDIGTKRIGVALASADSRVARPVATVSADAPQTIRDYLQEYEITDIVVGRPRNQAGDTTAQTKLVEEFMQTFSPKLPVHWQDESLTSVMAEQRLKQSKKPYTPADIDAEAAAIILQDFLETL